MKKLWPRSVLAALFLLTIMGVFVARLMNIQIIEAETYTQLIANRSLYTQVIKATRGEIVDRNGAPMAGNRMGFDVIIDKAALPRGRENEVLLNLMRSFESMGEAWTDALPITNTAPFAFLPDRETDVARLKKFLEVMDYTSAADVLYWLDELYKTGDYSPEDARKIVGVRYEMDRRGFAYEVPYTFATDVQISSVVRIKERSFELPGVDVIKSTVRTYPNGTIMPHLIGQLGPIYDEELEELLSKGYARNDIVGKFGMERAMEEYLHGQDGKREILCDANNQVVEAKESIPPVPGNTIVLTIDKDLQEYGQKVLEKQVRYLQDTAPAGRGKEADVASVVMLECKTGKVLVSATYPSYDLNEYSSNYSELINNPLNPLVNRAIQGLYAPGSCFKPVVATAGLAHNVIGENTPFFCGRVFHLPGSPQNFTCLDYHGNINVINALRWSCNIFFYNTGMRVGIENLDKTAMQYGLGELTGIEVPEKQGQRSNPETKLRVEEVEWYPGDVLQSSIGQLHHAYTPIQLANYAATIANRGTRMKLSMVEEIRDYSQQTVIKPFAPQVVDHVDASPEAFETVVKGMVAASRIGTARAQFANYPVDVASKTGTPESIDLPNSTFICFAPAEDPVVAIAVVIEKGWHGYTGAPVAKDLFDKYFGYGEFSPEALAAASSAPPPEDNSQQPENGSQPAENSSQPAD